MAMPWIAVGDIVCKPPRIGDLDRSALPVSEPPRVEEGWVEATDVLLTESVLDGSDAEVIELTDVHLRRVTILVGPETVIRLWRCRLDDVDLSSCRVESMRECLVTGSKLAATDITDGSLENVVFDNCRLDATDFFDCRLRRVSFTESDLTNVRFDRAELSDVSFDHSRLTNVEISGTRFEHVDMRGAVSIGLAHLSAMHGVTITVDQALELAVRAADALGFGIERPPG